MPRITYKAQTSDDPVFVRVGNYRFEHGKAVAVDQVTYDDLKANPWFGGDAPEPEVSGATAGGGPAAGDSSINVAYPPGSGSKYPGADLVKTEAGMVPGGEAETDETIGEYEVKHKGRGRYDVVKGGETVQSGLSRTEAEDWVRARTV